MKIVDPVAEGLKILSQDTSSAGQSNAKGTIQLKKMTMIFKDLEKKYIKRQDTLMKLLNKR